MFNIVLLILLIAVVVLIIRKLHVIAVAVFFGALILMLAVTVLRDQLHLPVNDYIDTTNIDNLRDTVVPFDFGENEDGKIITVIKDDDGKEIEVKEDEINYEYLSDDERERLEDNLDKILDGEEIIIDEDESKEIKENVINNELIEKENLEKESQEFLETENNTLILSYSKDLKDNESRKSVYNEIVNLVSDENFYSKFMGMSEYVSVEYDLGNGKMYNNGKGELVIILYR